MGDLIFLIIRSSIQDFSKPGKVTDLRVCFSHRFEINEEVLHKRIRTRVWGGDSSYPF
jgi:hypothetical protein